MQNWVYLTREQFEEIMRRLSAVEFQNAQLLERVNALEYLLSCSSWVATVGEIIEECPKHDQRLESLESDLEKVGETLRCLLEASKIDREYLPLAQELAVGARKAQRAAMQKRERSA